MLETGKTLLFLSACLGACATGGHRIDEAWARPTLSGALPIGGLQGDGPPTAPENTTMPIGLGLTTGPSSTLVGATLDFPLDQRITFGPSLLYGFDDDVTLGTLTGQLKYFLPAVGSPEATFSVLPYLTVGAGVAGIDKDGRSGDSGMLLDFGAGLRFLTGEHYRIGSEARLNYMPDDVAGEHAFFSLEVLQVVLSF